MTAYMPIAPLRLAQPRWIVPPAAVAALSIALAALLLRAGLFGNAITGLDEQFYLLVGDRMLQGDLPYVDIWDRKPIGLFLLFAAIAALPGNGVVAAQLVATFCAAGTAWCVTLIARRSVGWRPATMAGIFYLAALGELWGDTTQASVFYNLLIATAALLTLRVASSPEKSIAISSCAMLLAGLAIQIKTNAVFEGAYLGLWLLWSHWRRHGSPALLVRQAALLVLAGAVPTLSAMLGYAALGEFGAWWQANILSVVDKGRVTDQFAISTLVETEVLFAPVLLLTLLGLRARTARFTRFDRDTMFQLGWIGVALVDFTAIGGYFPHYAVPLLLACCPAIASAFARRRWGGWIFALVLIWPMVHSLRVNPRMTRREQAIAAEVLAALPPDVRTRCLFIYEGPPIYYHLTHACFVSRYVFTAHLSSLREAPSLGIDPEVALRAALSRRPGTVVTVMGSQWTDRNPAQEQVLMSELRAHYRIAAVVPYRPSPVHGKLAVWRRR